MPQVPGKGQIELIIDVGNEEMEDFEHYGNLVGVLEKSEYCPCLSSAVQAIVWRPLSSSSSRERIQHSLSPCPAGRHWIPSRFHSAPLRRGQLAFTRRRGWHLYRYLRRPWRSPRASFCPLQILPGKRGEESKRICNAARERRRKRGTLHLPRI
ncbi:hypothetical protein CORC01_14285 [Colletotrichum orchidophilum]|uniref:Uncharacterized protein n=1 Tax=Colletotrichum orchidophilum TaxID=1209926 RepID=A0A1G4AMW7_9PEZI|nr:uncharacterized protein CORC01_14285 [Colletotrichum orchidophilum]OHE90425.1 hypothetical protein CORC01_14285 [Colletotrichum orchidophilum]